MSEKRGGGGRGVRPALRALCYVVLSALLAGLILAGMMAFAKYMTGSP